MKLASLRPKWVGDLNINPDYPDARGQYFLYGILRPGSIFRRGLGMSFQCPHCKEVRLAIWFENPLDGGACQPIEVVPVQDGPERAAAIGRNRRWKRAGDNFENLSLSPSVDASSGGHWHGFITNGEALP